MFGNYYNPQITKERIDTQIAQLQQMKEQLPPVQQPTNLTQNFQLAPTQNGMKYVNTIEDVKKEMVYFDTPFFSKDLSVLWIKNSKNEIKAYTLAEIIQKDDKDMIIESLQYKVSELEKELNKNEKYGSSNDNESATKPKSPSISVNKPNKSK